MVIKFIIYPVAIWNSTWKEINTVNHYLFDRYNLTLLLRHKWI